jgi:hypothetical protein
VKNLIFAVLVAREPSLFGSAKAAGDNDVKLGEVGGAPFGQRPTRGLEAHRPHHRRRARKGRMFIMAYMIISPLARRAVTGLCWLVAIMAGLLGFQRVRLAIGRVGPFSLRSRFALPVSALTFCAGPPLSSSGACDRVPRPKKRAKQKVIQSITGAVFIGFLVVAGLDFRFVWSAVRLCILILGHVLTILSFSGIYLVFRENSFASSTIETAADQRRVDTGPYAIIRHPHDPDLPPYNVTLRGTRRRPQLFVATA